MQWWKLIVEHIFMAARVVLLFQIRACAWTMQVCRLLVGATWYGNLLNKQGQADGTKLIWEAANPHYAVQASTNSMRHWFYWGCVLDDYQHLWYCCWSHSQWLLNRYQFKISSVSTLVSSFIAIFLFSRASCRQTASRPSVWHFVSIIFMLKPSWDWFTINYCVFSFSPFVDCWLSIQTRDMRYMSSWCLKTGC